MNAIRILVENFKRITIHCKCFAKAGIILYADRSTLTEKLKIPNFHNTLCDNMYKGPKIITKFHPQINNP